MIDAIMGVLGTIIYPLFGIIFLLIDGIQDIFKAFAGIGDVAIGGKTIGGDAHQVTITGENTGALNDTGLVYYLFQSTIIRNIFISILVLALFLIIIFTVMAFIKNAYSSKPKKWQDIVGNAFIGLANFIFIPVCCLLGVWLGNILLNAIDGATNYAGATSMSRMLFVSSAYNANEFRQENTDVYKLNSGKEMYDEVMEFVNELKEKYEWEYNGTIEERDWDRNGDKEEIESAKAEVCEYYAGIIDEIYAQCEHINIVWYGGPAEWYQLMNVNYVILAGGGIFLIYALASISFGMVKRLFTLLLLFVISPALCAMYPLDDGKAVGSWKSDFVKNTISAYGAVAGLNLFFSIIPIVQQINLVGGKGYVLDKLGLTSLLLTIAGLYVVKDFISMISSYIGAGNAYSEGSGLMGNVKKRVGGMAKKTGKFAAGTAGAFQRARGAAKQAKQNDESVFGAFFGSMGRSSWEATKGGIKTFTGIDFDGTKKTMGDKFNEGYAARKKKYDEKKDGKYGELKAASIVQGAFAGGIDSASTAKASHSFTDDMKKVYNSDFDATLKGSGSKIDPATGLAYTLAGQVGLGAKSSNEQKQSVIDITSTFEGMAKQMNVLSNDFVTSLSSLTGSLGLAESDILDLIKSGDSTLGFGTAADEAEYSKLVSIFAQMQTVREGAEERAKTTDTLGNAAMQQMMNEVTAGMKVYTDAIANGTRVTLNMGESLSYAQESVKALGTKMHDITEDTPKKRKEITTRVEDSKRKGGDSK